MAYIKLDNVSFNYRKDQPVLKNISLEINKGDWVSILGHNGSGKSTLAKLLIYLLKADKGTIEIDGVKLTEKTALDIRKKIGIVFQNPDNQFVGVTVEDDIAFGMENLCFDRAKILQRIETYSKKVNMHQYLKKEPHNLSGGQKQRVAIAGILAMDTDILIFDEATSMLDPASRDQIMDFIKQLKAEGKTIITITHDMKEAIKSNNIIILNKGEVLAQGDTKKILTDKRLLNTSNLELLLPLKLMHRLKQENIHNEELGEILWQLSLNA
ncbi:MAG: energy-coupling factor transporter ATPase [Candidatus Izimaplasma sp.]|nr:energy-coupling factor transporter ATPase [Candidatus Izimaplasma bacterium]